MEQYMSKATVMAEIKDLYEDIDKCIGDLVLAESKYDQRRISEAHWKMETLMVNTQQVLSYILQYLEVKKADFEKMWKEYFKYRGDVATVNVKHLAKHFFELGLKAQKGKEV